MKTFVTTGIPFSWRKKGLLVEPSPDGFSHASHPCAVHISGDQFVIAYTRRDAQRRSHIFLVRAVVSEGNVLLTGEPQLALGPGDPCFFDCDGVISVCFVTHRQSFYLYYVGWQNLPEGRWICDTGRVRMDPISLSLERQFKGPVFGRDKSNPLFAAATAIHVSGDAWQTWYNSGIRWENTPSGWKHYYGIHYAHSENGVDWVSEPGLCLPFADEYEYAFGRPTVIRTRDGYFMWYAHRATKSISTYRIGFAWSEDGRKWIRRDELSGIDVSPSGWDSEMICYPCVFEHEKWLYMLYNGNNYGASGFGLAVLEDRV